MTEVTKPATEESTSLSSSMEDLKVDAEAGADGDQPSKKALKKLQKQQEKAAAKAARQNQRTQQQQDAAANEPDVSEGHYGRLPLNQSSERPNRTWHRLADWHAKSPLVPGKEQEGTMVWLKARVHNVRAKGKQAFMVLRQQQETVQALAAVDGETISKQMVKFIGR